MNGDYRDLFVSASDGLRLYARDYGPTVASPLPVVCLAGLTRNSVDFHSLALALSRDEQNPRRVLALDYRGRGRSERAADWQTYDVRIEVDDTLQVLTAAGIDRAIFVGTSRGGLIIMVLAAFRPAILRGAVLNDVGPALDPKGLARIRSYVGKLPVPRDSSEAARILEQFSGGQFPRYTQEQWERMAQGTWISQEGRLVLSYDPNLLKPLEALDLDGPLPDLWPLFEGLKAVPVLAVRGANSDLLAPDTFARMQTAHPRLTAITIPDEGHAPEIEGDLIASIRRFVTEVDSLTDERAA